ncbi:MAG: hypothetical protein OEZ23_06840 [Gammaproteobacteria bacterium]|nr:hypothetical protein [Gammaproteobacteria bacterium]
MIAQELLDPLSIIAEFSIGLAGFAGIVAALSHFKEEMRELVEFRFANLLITAFAPGFFALMTISLSIIGVDALLNLQISKGLLLLYLLSWMGWAAIKTPPGVHPLFRLLMWSIGLLNICLLTYSLMNNADNSLGYYMAGLSLILLNGAIVFTGLALLTLKHR